MKELSLNVLDITKNSVKAGATLIHISLVEVGNLLTLTITDNGCGMTPEDAATVIAQIEDRFPALKGKVQLTYVGTTIGAHTGPGAVGLFFWGDRREEE